MLKVCAVKALNQAKPLPVPKPVPNYTKPSYSEPSLNQHSNEPCQGQTRILLFLVKIRTGFVNNKPCKDYKSIMIKKIRKSKDDVDEEVTQVILFNNLTKLTILKLV